MGDFSIRMQFAVISRQKSICPDTTNAKLLHLYRDALRSQHSLAFTERPSPARHSWVQAATQTEPNLWGLEQPPSLHHSRAGIPEVELSRLKDGRLNILSCTSPSFCMGESHFWHARHAP